MFTACGEILQRCLKRLRKRSNRRETLLRLFGQGALKSKIDIWR
jgi:hypothetical protein